MTQERKPPWTPGTPCILWTGALDDDGYGRVMDGGKWRPAHVVAYEREIGPVPQGLQLDHLCRNRACRNTEHLEPVTRRVNILRGIGPTAINARKTHCDNGHPLTEDNLCPWEHGRRQCRECKRERNRRHMRKVRAA